MYKTQRDVQAEIIRLRKTSSEAGNTLTTQNVELGPSSQDEIPTQGSWQGLIKREQHEM